MKKLLVLLSGFVLLGCAEMVEEPAPMEGNGEVEVVEEVPAVEVEEAAPTTLDAEAVPAAEAEKTAE